MRYVIGIDSGGTKYLVKAANLKGQVLGKFEGLPAGFRFDSLQCAVKKVSQNIDSCLSQFGGNRADCVYMVCGSTGIDSKEDYFRIKEVYENLPGFSCPLRCVNDAEVAQYAATGGIGVLVISGTGSIAFGRNAQGETARSGGWWLSMAADEGSGTYITVRALQHLALWFDHRIDESKLALRLKNTLYINKRKDLITLGRSSASKWGPLNIPQIVDQAAEQGDAAALRIIQDAAGHTYDLANSVVKKLNFDKDLAFKVGVWGSAITKSRLHFHFFKEKFENEYHHVQVILPEKDAADGALQMALDLLKKR